MMFESLFWARYVQSAWCEITIVLFKPWFLRIPTIMSDKLMVCLKLSLHIKPFTPQFPGLSFSVLPPTKPPGSLKNIYKQIALDYPSFVSPKSGYVQRCFGIRSSISVKYSDLTPLAKAGVLWLNTSLTVRAHKAASHANKGWETFTAQAIRAVIDRQGDNHKGVVFMAWGLPAQKTCTKIGIDEVSALHSS